MVDLPQSKHLFESKISLRSRVLRCVIHLGNGAIGGSAAIPDDLKGRGLLLVNGESGSGQSRQLLIQRCKVDSQDSD